MGGCEVGRVPPFWLLMCWDDWLGCVSCTRCRFRHSWVHCHSRCCVYLFFSGALCMLALYAYLSSVGWRDGIIVVSSVRGHLTLTSGAPSPNNDGQEPSSLPLSVCQILAFMFQVHIY